MNTELELQHLLIYKGRTLLEAMAVEMTAWQCISTAIRGVTQGFPANFADKSLVTRILATDYVKLMAVLLQSEKCPSTLTGIEGNPMSLIFVKEYNFKILVLLRAPENTKGPDLYHCCCA